jgi:ribosomal protein S18 acetylase RimI-like enzyme
VTSAQTEDARRFHDWQVDALRQSAPGTERFSVGPFQVVAPADPGADSWVTLLDPDLEESDVRTSLGRLRAMFAERHAELQIEFNEGVVPQAGPWLEAAGLELVERNPLMACRPPVFRPFAAAGVKPVRLRPSSAEADLVVFQTIRWTEGNMAGRQVPPVDRLRQELVSAASVYLLAWLDGEPVGTGVSHGLNGAAEIVGIVTRSDTRRRGVAATVSSNLVERHFESGGDFVFLDAASDDAVRVYERLGFVRFGANLVYR